MLFWLMLLPVATVAAIGYMFAIQMLISSGIDEVFKDLYRYLKEIVDELRQRYSSR